MHNIIVTIFSCFLHIQDRTSTEKSGQKVKSKFYIEKRTESLLKQLNDLFVCACFCLCCLCVYVFIPYRVTLADLWCAVASCRVWSPGDQMSVL